MDHTFKYVVLTAIPDRGRGERVNVGILVFTPDRIDVRLAELDKLKALTGVNWKAYAEDMRIRFLLRFPDPQEALESVQGFKRIDPYVEASDVAWFSISRTEEYEITVTNLMRSMVLRPEEPSPHAKSTRINTQIARVLKQAKALAKPDEPLETHRVRRDMEIEDELNADFSQKNGVWRIATTLDCTRSSGVLKEASLKAVTLDRARVRFGEDTKLLGIFVPSPIEEKNSRAALHILKEYSDMQFNWSDVDDRKRLVNFFFSGMGASGPLM